MNPPAGPTNSSTPRNSSDPGRDAASPGGEEDFAIGCECANPALQIESWGEQAAAQPLQQFH
jgi:hypothetical protein